MQRPINSFYRSIKKDREIGFDDFDEDRKEYSVIDLVFDNEAEDDAQRPSSSSKTLVKHAVAESTKAFNILPIEMNQRVAKYLDCDQDLENFRVTCKATYNSIDGDNFSFWRRHFLQSFEPPLTKVNNAWYRQEYLWRKSALNNGARFSLGHSRDEAVCLQVLRKLINESFSDKSSTNASAYTSRNLAELRRFVQNHSLISNIFDPQHQRKHAHGFDRFPRPTEPLLQEIQILLAPLIFEPNLLSDETPFQFPLSQQMAYATADVQPIFINGVNVNFPWLLHQLNFWKYHMKREAELTLHDAYASLEPHERPRFWNNLIGQERPMGRQWKGAYGYVDHADIDEVRRGENNEFPIQDEFSGDEGNRVFQDISLSLSTSGEADWNPVFEVALKSLGRPALPQRTRAQSKRVNPDELTNRKSRSFRFTGDGDDNEETFLADGWLNPLPEQDGIPGWQRMTMMKYFKDGATGHVDYESLWAYEGVVLPGGQMIVGRWWSPTDGDVSGHYTGPFIQWCVDAD